MERPILFSGEMVRAILDDRKTMTRRVVKKQPPFEADGCHLAFSAEEGWWDFYEIGNPVIHRIKSPFILGHHLWVRESCYVCGSDSDGAPLADPPVAYAADGAAKSDIYPYAKPSIFMPRWASRITLEITNVRTERLRSITVEDIDKEGFGLENDCKDRDAWFARLWDTLNAKRGYGWDVSPWVWVIEFKRI